MRKWADEGEVDKIISSVPVVTAWHTATAKSEDGGDEFRVPKASPFNPEKTPDEFEARFLDILKIQGSKEYHGISNQVEQAAASSEQLASCSEQLGAQASTLDEVVCRFQLSC